MRLPALRYPRSPGLQSILSIAEGTRVIVVPMIRGKETLGQRLARLRKERGFTQVELAEKIGIVQTLVTDYETDRLRLSAEMALRFALALHVTVDELLRPKSGASPKRKPSRKVLREIGIDRSSAAHSAKPRCHGPSTPSYKGRGWAEGVRAP